MELVMLPDIHLYWYWFISILSISVADSWATLGGRVIWGIKLLDSAISKNWFTPVFCAYLIKSH